MTRLEQQLRRISDMSQYQLQEYSKKIHMFNISADIRHKLIQAIGDRTRVLAVDREAAIVNNGEIRLGEVG